MDYAPLILPFLKPKGFAPDIVKRRGIPRYADSTIKGNKVVGTAAWKEWWDEQIYYCLHGYETAGVHIPGRCYYHLNFNYLSTVGRGIHHPDYNDLTLEFFLVQEEAKRTGYGMIVPKGRRKGISENSASTMNYGVRFIPKYQAAVVSGQKTYSLDLMSKFDYANSMSVPELKMKRLEDNENDIEFGWIEKEEGSGTKIECGSRSHIFIKTAFTNPNILKGTMLNDCFFEESGELDLLCETFDATESCFKVGERIVGTGMVYGTGNKMAEGTKQFEKMWHEHEAYRLIRFFVPGNRMYFPCVQGSINEFGQHEERIPNLMQYKPWQIIGCEDTVEADASIDKQLALLNLNPDKTKYINYKQNHPRTIQDVFTRSVGNDFNKEVIEKQLWDINSGVGLKPAYYKPRWVKEENGQFKSPLQVEMIPVSSEQLQDKDFLSECVEILFHPEPGYNSLDVGGADSYDKDQSKTSKSLGAMVVFRGVHDMSNKPMMLPICLIRTRPKQKETFYEMCCMVSVYYNLFNDTLIDVANGLIFKHYEQLGLKNYLSERPKKFESEGSQQMHEKGVALTGYSRPRMVGLLQSYYNSHGYKVWFKQMLMETLDYNEKDKDSDNDTVDAFGIALMRYYDRSYGAVNVAEENKMDLHSLPEWRDDGRGNMIPVETGATNKNSVATDPFIRMMEQGII